MSCPLETWYADDLVAVQASIDEIRTEGTRRLRETEEWLAGESILGRGARREEEARCVGLDSVGGSWSLEFWVEESHANEEGA